MIFYFLFHRVLYQLLEWFQYQLFVVCLEEDLQALATELRHTRYDLL